MDEFMKNVTHDEAIRVWDKILNQNFNNETKSDKIDKLPKTPIGDDIDVNDISDEIASDLLNTRGYRSKAISCEFAATCLRSNDLDRTIKTRSLQDCKNYCKMVVGCEWVTWFAKSSRFCSYSKRCRGKKNKLHDCQLKGFFSGSFDVEGDFYYSPVCVSARKNC